MYDFKREGFPGFPLGQEIEFYGQKLPEPRMVVTDLPGTDRSIRTLIVVSLLKAQNIVVSHANLEKTTLFL